MRDHSKHIVLGREEAVERLVGAARFSPRTEKVPVHQAFGRVTACDCPALVDVPNALCAQMDGIAVRFCDFEGGLPDTSGWQLGREYDWANTGTALPEGYDTAIRIEDVRFDGGVGHVGADGENPGQLEIVKAPEERGASCRERGATFAQGQPLIAAGTRLTPVKVSALVMCGYSEVEVVAKPRVAFIPTGDELVSPGNELPTGKAYDSNGVLIEGKLLQWGAEPIIYDCIPDDWDTIEATLRKACSEAEIVVINAGSSKGSKDFTMEILEEMGEVICHETNHGPGRHTSASVVDGVPVLGLSGPPAGCEITSDWYLKPLVDSYLYGHAVEFEKVAVRWSPDGAEVGFERGKPFLGELVAVDAKERATEKGVGEQSPAASAKPAMSAVPGAPENPAKSFFTIRPVSLGQSSQGPAVMPFEGGPHPNLLDLDDANGYLVMEREALASLKAGDEVRVELRQPY